MFSIKNSISLKFSYTLIAGICILMAAIGLSIYNVQKNQIIEELKNTIKHTADRLAHNIVYPLWNIDKREIDRMIALEMADKNINAVVLNANIMTIEVTFGKYRDVSGKLLGVDNKDMGDKLSEKAFLTLDRKIQKDSVTLGYLKLIGTDKHLRENLNNLILQIFLITASTVLLVSILSIICLKTMVTKPIKALEDATIKIKKGNFDTSIDYLSGDEIGRVTSSFNKMAQQLERNFKEIKSAHQELKKSQETFSGFFNQGNIGMAITSVEKGWVNVNKKLCDMLGYSKNELIKMTWAEMTYPDDLEPDLVLFRKLISEEINAYEMEKRFIRKDKKNIYTHLTVSCMRHEDGSVDKVLATLQDMSNQKQAEKEKHRLEDQLRQAQKLEAIGTLAGGVAHDFNNLLSIIIGYTELLIDEADIGNRHQESLKEIYDASLRAKSVTRQLLAFSRKQVLEAKVIDVNLVIKDFEKMIRRFISEDIELKIKLMSGQFYVKADISQMEQVLMNIAVNARDAMPDGGSLTIETEAIYLDESYTRGKVGVTPGSYVMISVSDTGTGIPKDNIDNIFEPFFTTKKEGKGTGLGLSTVYGIIKQHGGNIWVYSEIDQGSTFKIYLPQSTESASEEHKTSDKIEAISGPATVLLVEDEPSVRKLASRILSEHGYMVLEAESVEDAIQKAKEYKKSIHILLTDVIMPGMKGPEVYQHISDHHSETKILYMSGYTQNIITRRGLLKDGVNLLQKPFSKKSLIDKVAEVLSA